MGVTAINRRSPRKRTSVAHKALVVAMVAAWAGVFAAAYALGRPKAKQVTSPAPALATGTPAPSTPAPSTSAPSASGTRPHARTPARAHGIHPKISGLTPLPAPPAMRPRRPFISGGEGAAVPAHAPILPPAPPATRSSPPAAASPPATTTPPPTTTGGGPHTSGGGGGGSTTVGTSTTSGGSGPTATDTTPTGASPSGG